MDVNTLVLVKGEDRYVFMWDDANRVEVLRQAGYWAGNVDLSFTWYDAACICQRIREEEAQRRAIGSRWNMY